MVALVYDERRRRWVEPRVAKQVSVRGRGRFSNVSVGDQIMRSNVSRRELRLQRKEDGIATPGERQKCFEYAIVTDIWFDPVAGQHDRLKGEMVAIQPLLDGRAHGAKRAHTVRGLATNKWQYAKRAKAASWEIVGDTDVTSDAENDAHAHEVRTDW
jgi:hypothetical protein